MSKKTSDMSMVDLPPIYGLVWGSSGVGKTHFIGSCPKPIYIFDWDRGLLTLRGKEGIEYDTYMKEGGWTQSLAQLTKLEKDCPYATVGIDSISTMQDAAMSRLIQVGGKKEMDLKEWGRLIESMRDLFLRFRILTEKHGCNVIVTAHDQVVKDEMSGAVQLKPLIVGKLAGKLPLFFDEVYRLEPKRSREGVTEYLMQTKADRSWV